MDREPLTEAHDNAVAQLLIELVFLLPPGTDATLHPIAARLREFKRTAMAAETARADREAAARQEAEQKLAAMTETATAHMWSAVEQRRQADRLRAELAALRG